MIKLSAKTTSLRMLGRPGKSRGNGKRDIAQRAHVVCRKACAVALRDQLLESGDLTRGGRKRQVQFGSDPFGNHVLVLLKDPIQPVIFPEEYLSGGLPHCGACGSLHAVPPNLPGGELRIPTTAGEALREGVLGLTVLQLLATAELLAFCIERSEPWSEDNEEPLTEIHESWVVVQRGYEAISRAVERGLSPEPKLGPGEH